MKKKFKLLSLAMSLAMLAPSIAWAQDPNLDAKISQLDSEVKRLEAEYDSAYKTFEKFSKSSKAYLDKNGKFVSNEKAVQENLFKISTKLDEYVANVTPSLEQAMLGVYFMNGAKGNGYVIRPKNANDLYQYLKGHFVMKEGLDKKAYDALLIDYVNAISDSVILPNLDKATDTIYDQVVEIKKKLDDAKTLRSYYKREKNKDLIDRLEKAIARSERTVKSCKFLMKNSPKTIAHVRGKLEKMVADQEELIVRSKKALNKFVEGL